MAKTTTETTERDHYHERDHGEVVHESAMDYAEHEKSYAIFLGVLKWSTISIAVLVVILYFLVQP
jgi:hypothetical protein